MTLEVALTIVSKRDRALWQICYDNRLNETPASLRETALDIVTCEVERLQKELDYAYRCVRDGFEQGVFDFSMLRAAAHAALTNKETA